MEPEIDLHKTYPIEKVILKPKGLMQRYRLWKLHRVWRKAWKEAMERSVSYDMLGKPRYEDLRRRLWKDVAFLVMTVPLAAYFIYLTASPWLHSTDTVRYLPAWRPVFLAPTIFFKWKAVDSAIAVWRGRKAVRDALVDSVHDL